MNQCSNCGSVEQDEIAICATCGELLSGDQRVEMYQLEFLFECVSAWNKSGWLDLPDNALDQYARRLRELQVLFRSRTQPVPDLVPEPLTTPQPTPKSPRAVIELDAPSGLPWMDRNSVRQEPFAFDEWLLSERNIKIALWAGALLLVMAGIIFMVSKWDELGGPFKLACTIVATAVMFFVGFVLHENRSLKLAGRAMLSVASGFFALNFAILQMYVLSPAGFPASATWLVASCLCLASYAYLASLTGFGLFTYAAVGAVYSALMAALVLAELSWHPAVPLAYGMLAIGLVLLAQRAQYRGHVELVARPLIIIAHATVPFTTLASLTWLYSTSPGSLWWGAAGGFVGVLFYIANDLLLGWRAARWAAVTLVSLTLGLTLVQTGLGDDMAGTLMLLVALIYQGTGHVIERRQKRFGAALSLYSNAYSIVAVVTAVAARDLSQLTPALFGDVLVLLMASFIHRRPELAYSTVWLFMLPVYLVLAQTVSSFSSQAIQMGALGLSYAAAGYVLGRQEVTQGSLPLRGGPFLTAAAFLSAVVIKLAWGDAVASTALLLGSGGLYLAASFWLRRPSALVPALIALNLCVLTTARLFSGYDFVASVSLGGTPQWRVLDATYAILALCLLVGACALRRLRLAAWSGPLYLVAALDMAVAYGVGLLDMPMAISLSAVNAAALLTLAWTERPEIDFAGLRRIPILSFLGLAFVVVGHFHTILAIGLAPGWPAHVAVLLALLVAISWALKSPVLTRIYGSPLRWTGLVLGVLPAGAAFISAQPLLVAVVFAVFGLQYLGEAIRWRNRCWGYLACSALLIVYWAILYHSVVAEPQAYAIPAGLALLVADWNERRQANRLPDGLASLVGLALLLGLSFSQSVQLGATVYAPFLGAESLGAIGWGVRVRSRNYVTVGAIALIAGGLAQFGPGFTELPRWLQLSLTGSILLGGAIVMLLKREQVLSARHAFAGEWGKWKP